MQIGLIGELICPPTLSTLISRRPSDTRSQEHASDLFSTLIAPSDSPRMFSHPRRPNWRILLSSTLARDSPTVGPCVERDCARKKVHHHAKREIFICRRRRRLSRRPRSLQLFLRIPSYFPLDATFHAHAPGGKAVRGESSGAQRPFRVEVSSKSPEKSRRSSIEKMSDSHQQRMLSEKRTQKNIILKNVFFFAFEYRKVSQNCSFLAHTR